MGRLLRFVAVILVGAVLAAVHFADVLGISQQLVVAQAVAMRNAFTLLCLAIAIVSLFLALIWKRKTGMLVIVTLAVGGLSGWVVLDRGLELTTDIAFEAVEPSSDETQLRVLAWNTDQDQTEPNEVAQLALERDANIIALPETNPLLASEVAEILGEHGKPMQLVPDDPTDALRQSTLLVSDDLGEYRYVADNSQVIPAGIIAEPLSASLPTIVVAHAQQPGFNQDQAQIWRDHLAWFEQLCAEKNTIIVGDFNATLDNIPGQTLGQCRNISLEASTASTGTWPTGLPTWLGAPIDQFYVTPDWRVDHVSVIVDRDDAGSDHRPVFSVLSATD